jgi:hypothetical protein
MPHLLTLHPCLADLWESITKEFGFFCFRNDNQVACYACKQDLQAAWELFTEEVKSSLTSN